MRLDRHRRVILSGLCRKNRQWLEAASQQVLNQHGHPTYTTLKRAIGGIDNDQKRQQPVVPAASTRKRGRTTATATTDVYVRDASNYARPEGER